MANKFTHKTKTIIANWGIKDYIRQLSIVVLGIIITFVGSDILSTFNQQREVANTLQLVKSELLQNKQELQAMQEQVVFERKASLFMFKHKDNLAAAPRDSLDMYANSPFQWSSFTFISDAMEMMKASALIQKIENKELALHIIKTYAGINEASDNCKSFYSTKRNLQNNLSNNQRIKEYLTETRPFIEMWSFLLTQPEGKALVKQIPQILGEKLPFNAAIQYIDSTIEQINKEYN